MAKEEIIHKDRLGRELKVGDCVAYPAGNTLVIGLIKKINPKMVGVSALGKARTWSVAKNKYPMDCVRLDGPEVTMYLLKGE